jgi:HSP20 family protein
MSSSEDRDIEPFDWFNRFFGSSSSRRSGRGGGSFGFPDVFRGFDQMKRDMEREFEDTFKNIGSKAPKDLVREYETSTGDKVTEYGPFVYGYSMTIGPDGKPKVREFGNVRSPISSTGSFSARPLISSEREPLADVTTTDKEVKVVVEIPGVSKENIKVNAYDNSVEVTTTGTERKYHEVVEIPPQTDIETATSSYKNGILEITFKKKEQFKPKGKLIKIE